MKIVFVDTRDDEQPYFADTFSAHTVEFVESAADVPADADIVSVSVDDEIGEKFLAAHTSVRLVATRSSTTDHLDEAAAATRGVTLAYVPDYGTAAVAEHTFALIFGVVRRLRHHMAREGKHRKVTAAHGMELRGKTLGIAGTGRVGWQVAAAARGFGMRVVAYDIAPDEELARETGFSYLELDALMHASDIVTLHLPLNRNTYHVLDRRRLALGKPGQVIINTARGALIEQAALLEALESGQLGGLGLDVLEDESALRGDSTEAITSQIIKRLHAGPAAGGGAADREHRLQELQGMLHNRRLLAHPNVFYTPGIGYDSIEALEAMDRYTAENITRFLAGNLRPQAVVRS